MKWLSVICVLYVALLIVQPAIVIAGTHTETSCCTDTGCSDEEESSRPSTPCAGESCNPFHVQACACCVGFTTYSFSYIRPSVVIESPFLQVQEVRIPPHTVNKVWQPPKHS